MGLPGEPEAAAGLCSVRGINTWRMPISSAPREAASFLSPRTLHENAVLCAMSDKMGGAAACVPAAMCASALRGHHPHCPHGGAAARVTPRAARGAGRARPVASSHQRARTVWSQGGCHGGRRPRSTPRSRPRRRCAPGCSPLWWQRRGGAGGGGGGGMSSRHGSGPRRLLLPAERARRAAGGEGRPTVKPRRPPRGRLHGTRCRRPRSPPWCAARACGARGGSDERHTALREALAPTPRGCTACALG